MKETEAIFKLCHELTKALIRNTSFDYHCTFTACLKLYNNSNHDFIVACKYNDIDISPIAKISDADFDFYILLSLVDNDKTAEKKLNSLVNFAVNYGLKKRDAFRSISDAVNDTVSDNYNPISVDNLIKNDLEDLKQEIILYMLNREKDNDFQELPNVFKLLRAGDCIVTNYSRKETARAKNTFSISILEENGIQISDEKDDYSDTIAIDSIISDIATKLPKVHRELAQDIIRLYCISYKGNVVKKARTQTEIADILGVSVRTVKSIWQKITSLNPTQFR